MYVRIIIAFAVNTVKEVKIMESKVKKQMSRNTRLFFKSAIWTIVALSLIALGYFGAEMLFG